MPVTRRRVLQAGLAAAASAAQGCRSGPAEQAGNEAVTVYVSLDEPYARPVLEAFEQQSGIRVRQVYDTEASKSRGLAQRILAERRRPQADVFWSSEAMQTLMLREEGLLEPYQSPSAEGIPERFRDPEGYWTGFAARLRVLVYHRPTVKQPPRGLLELSDPKWKGEVAMANPLFGTTMTEAAALFQLLGESKAAGYYRARKANGTRIVDGNSVAAELAARGEVSVAQTDTDDAFIRVDGGRPLEVVFPDQSGFGTLLIPNTAGLVRGGPAPASGRKFLDFLLRSETELLLASLPSRQLPLHEGVHHRLPERVRPLKKIKTMALDYGRLQGDYRQVDRFLRETFLG